MLKIKLKIRRRFQNNNKLKPGNLEICMDARWEIIEVGLVEIFSTQAACHVVTKRIPDIHRFSMDYPWKIDVPQKEVTFSTWV